MQKKITTINAFIPKEVFEFPNPYILHAKAIGIAPIVAILVALWILQKVSGILITPITPANVKKIPITINTQIMISNMDITIPPLNI